MRVAARILVIWCLTTSMQMPHLQPLEQLIFVSGYPQWAHGVKGDGPFGRLLCCSSFVIPANWHQVHIWNEVSIGEETEWSSLTRESAIRLIVLGNLGCCVTRKSTTMSEVRATENDRTYKPVTIAINNPCLRRVSATVSKSERESTTFVRLIVDLRRTMLKTLVNVAISSVHSEMRR